MSDPAGILASETQVADCFTCPHFGINSCNDMCEEYPPPKKKKSPPDKQTGVKYDKNKDRWDLVPWYCLKQVVKVLTHGATKYSDDNWKRVPNPKQRYFSASQRHITAWWEGEKYDIESGYHHLAHAICCLLFAMWFDDKEVGDKALRFE